MWRYAKYGDGTLVGADDVHEHAKRRGLACAVGAYQAVYGPASHCEVDTANGMNLTE